MKFHLKYIWNNKQSLVISDFGKMTDSSEFEEENYELMEQSTAVEQSGWSLSGLLSTVVIQVPVMIYDCVAKLIRMK